MNLQAQYAQQSYVKSQTNTSHPGDLTLMLYSGCIRFMKQALAALQEKDFSGKNENIKRAQDIIDELIITLNMDYDISKNLSALYYFIKDQLMEANIKLKPECLKNSIELVSDLRDTWAEALKQVKQQSPTSR